MLATRFARMRETPVRYTLDPAHEQAIRNYLQIASRAMNVRPLAHAATPAMQQHLQGMYPEAQDVITDLTHRHRNNGLGMLLDLMTQEHGVGEVAPGHESATPITSLMYALRQLHNNTQGQPGGGAHPAVLRGYGSDALNNYDVYERTRRAVNPPGAGQLHLGRLLGHLAQYAPKQYREGLRSGRDYMASTGANSVLAVPDLHDITGSIAHELQSNLHGLGGTALTAHNQLGGLLQGLDPVLWHFGEHGTTTR